MNNRRIIIAVVVVLGLAGAAVFFSSGDGGLFKGQLLGQEQGEQQSPAPTSSTELPDLKATLAVLPPAQGSVDVIAEITLENIGKGVIDAKKNQITYELTIDGKKGLANEDTYTEIASGDKFSFKYPIAKTIYQYGSTGKVILSLDPANTIEETDETNNSVTVDFSL